jgi:hypothetical protein
MTITAAVLKDHLKEHFLASNLPFYTVVGSLGDTFDPQDLDAMDPDTLLMATLLAITELQQEGHL